MPQDPQVAEGDRAPRRPQFVDSEAQLEAFRAGVEELGGQRATADLFGVNERTIRDVVSGRRKLHTGFLRDMAAQLIAKADRCRTLEKRLSPAFVANLTAEQAAGENGRILRHDRARREQADG
jgi:DNA-binding transcriptional regulator YdaS (Cro superfamily)